MLFNFSVFHCQALEWQHFSPFSHVPFSTSKAANFQQFFANFKAKFLLFAWLSAVFSADSVNSFHHAIFPFKLSVFHCQALEWQRFSPFSHVPFSTSKAANFRPFFANFLAKFLEFAWLIVIFSADLCFLLEFFPLGGSGILLEIA